MNSAQGDAAIKPPPQFWYDIPYGYAQLEVYPSAERMAELAREVLALPDDVRERADEVFRLYALVMYEMQKHRVQGCALGLHPDERDGAAMSVLTVSSVDSPGVNPKAVLATLMASGAGETAESGIVPVELPCGPGFVTQFVQRPVPPGGSPVDGEGGVDETPVWRGLLAIPDTRSSAIIAIQLVTPSVHLADDYRGVLVGVGRTVSFTDPALAARTGDEPPEPGSAAAAVRSDFG
ncbi:hypothetical protein [Streptomyces abyssalis]|uniref:hypothetical protein n=1 Tax=Streptomyces abyssalis TaxID=933944 RepID=UPI00085C3169|nr:hypothetical protein [Streptomyces abyssalis]